MLFEDRTLTLMTYTIETIIAEKYQTVLERGILNSRMKDYYDLYYLLTNSSYDSNILKEAINKTFEKRHTDLSCADQIFEEIEKSDFLKNVWDNYANKHFYSKDIEFEKLIHIIKEKLL